MGAFEVVADLEDDGLDSYAHCLSVCHFGSISKDRNAGYGWGVEFDAKIEVEQSRGQTEDKKRIPVSRPVSQRRE